MSLSGKRKSFWYDGGLQFECAMCGDCCGGAPGYVWMSEEEIDNIAKHLEISRSSFLSDFCFKSWGKYSIAEKPNFDCVFWEKEKGCQIYEVRPEQCRAWPFWKDNIKTPRTWRETSEKCPGCNQGRKYSTEEINKIRDAAKKTMK